MRSWSCHGCKAPRPAISRAFARRAALLLMVMVTGAVGLLPASVRSVTAASPGAAAPASGSPTRVGAANEIKPFTGTLQKIYEAGVIRLGHRLNSPPFAFLAPDKKPIGYSLDICEVVVERIALHLHRSIDVELVPVTPSNRFDLVRGGQVDLECGSSTANDERRAFVVFSPTIFVTGTKLLVKRGSRIRSLRQLQGQTVVLSEGTVHAKLIPQIAERQKLDIEFVFARDHDASFEMLASGKAEAFANDDIQLAGMLAARDAASDYRVVGDFLTYADYALTLRRDDPDFAEVIDQAFEYLSGSGEIRAIYRRWFQRPLPSGVTLNLPMSPHLEHVFQLEGQYSD